MIVDAAGSTPAEAVALMLDLGFSPHARNGFGEQPLHTAAYHGNAAVVRVLLDAGADVDARDDRFDAHAAGLRHRRQRRAGRQAGRLDRDGTPADRGRRLPRRCVGLRETAQRGGHRTSCRRYGITPDEPAERQPSPTTTRRRPARSAPGVMADIARHLEAAYRDRGPRPARVAPAPAGHWTGVCSNRTQVLDWYRGLLADGTIATVNSVEVDRDAVVLGLAVARQAEGARPAPPQQLYQVFTVDGAQIVDIRGYPDRHSAFTRGQTGPQE